MRREAKILAFPCFFLEEKTTEKVQAFCKHAQDLNLLTYAYWLCYNFVIKYLKFSLSFFLFRLVIVGHNEVEQTVSFFFFL